MTTLTRIHQIELTSRCNLACVYCVHPKMQRPKVDMTGDTFERALEWFAHFHQQPLDPTAPRVELNLSGIGETFLHPAAADAILTIRRLFPHVDIVIPTNGLLVTEALVAKIAPARPRIYVSTHQPVKAARAIALLREAGLLAAVPTCDAAAEPMDWAGQVDWLPSTVRYPCPWLWNGQGFVAADGRIFTCCLDSTGESVIGDVVDPPMSLTMKPWRCCASCHQFGPPEAP